MIDDSPKYGGLIGLPGTRFLPSASMGTLICPLCGDESVIHLTGDVIFSAKMKMSHDDLSEGKLAAFVCPRSHIFFLMERDNIPEVSRAVA